MKLTGAEILVRALMEQNVDVVFGYPGGQVIKIYDRLFEHREDICHILTAHEQGAAHAADGYARASGKVGVVIATSGPGATNLTTGIATAFLDSVPMVAITGNVPCSLIGSDSFQEVDITGITMPVTKHNFFINRVSKLASTVREAFRLAVSGRPGPVLIDIPADIQSALWDYEPEPPVTPDEKLHADYESIKTAAELINKSEKPYIYCGGGVISGGASDEVIALADKIDGVIGCSLMGISAIPSDEKRFLGMQGMHGQYASSMALENADLVIAVGARFSERATGNKAKYAPNAKIIHIDVDKAEIDKNITVECGVNGDVKVVLKRLIDEIDEKKRSVWQGQIDSYRREQQRIFTPGEGMNHYGIFSVINKYIDSDTIIATDVGQHQMWTAQCCKFTKPRRFVSSGGLGTMGFGLGAAIGARMATGSKTVLVTGDGSFGMCLNELATAVRYSVPLVIVLLNNGVLGMVRQMQTLFYGGRHSATVLNRQTDFVKLADAFGAKGVRCESPEDFDQAFYEAYTSEGITLIECIIDKDEMVLPMLPGGGSMKDIIVEGVK